MNRQGYLYKQDILLSSNLKESHKISNLSDLDILDYYILTRDSIKKSQFHSYSGANQLELV